MTAELIPEVLTPAEACVLLNVSRSTLDKQTRLGFIPVIRLGKTVRYNKAHLLAMSKMAPSHTDLK